MLLRWMLLGVAVLSFLNTPIRADYNLPLGLFCFLVWEHTYPVSTHFNPVPPKNTSVLPSAVLHHRRFSVVLELSSHLELASPDYVPSCTDHIGIQFRIQICADGVDGRQRGGSEGSAHGQGGQGRHCISLWEGRKARKYAEGVRGLGQDGAEYTNIRTLNILHLEFTLFGCFMCKYC